MARALDMIDAAERFVIAVLAGSALLLACIAMVTRYVIPGLTLDWTFELTIFTTIWAAFLAGARSAGRGDHVRVDTLLTFLRPGTVRVFVVFACLMGVAVAAMLAVSGWEVVEEAYRWDERTTSTLSLPLWIYYLSLPVGAALIAFHLIVRALGIARGTIRDELGHHE